MMGFSCQKPVHEARQQDAALVRAWEAEHFQKIKERAKNVGASIFFGDEAGVRSDNRHGTTWAPVGETPVQVGPGRRFGFNMLSAISLRGELRFMLHEGPVDADVFITFLRRLMVGTDKPVFLIVDNLSIHTCLKTSDFVESVGDKLELFFLPTYSPQLNPSENVWSNVKRNVARRMPMDLASLRAFTIAALRRLRQTPGIVMGFFKQPECCYTLL